MEAVRKRAWLTLVVVSFFVGATAVAGGVGLMTGLTAVPVDWLKGSPFVSYQVPGLALFGVGVIALLAAVAVLRRHALGALLTVVAGLLLIGFEIVEIAVMGLFLDPPLQPVYLALGFLMLGLGARLWLLSHRPIQGTSRLELRLD